jgi:hypothetical protein
MISAAFLDKILLSAVDIPPFLFAVFSKYEKQVNNK